MNSEQPPPIQPESSAAPQKPPTPSPAQIHPQNPYVTPQHQVPHQPQKIGDQAGMRVLLPVGRSGWAIAAGYLGLLSPTIILAPLAVIISVLAIFHVNRSCKTENKKRGMGRAVFGLIMGLGGTGLLLYWMANGSPF